MYHEITHLRKSGLTVEERSPWHFQVMGSVIINVWPTKCKWMVAYDSGASFYEDAGDLLRIVTETLEARRRPISMSPTCEGSGCDTVG